MTTTASGAAAALAGAITARDFAAARDLLAADVDFRAMTPSRVWEAADPAGVEDVLRTWLDDPDEDVRRIDPVPGTVVEDTARVGWLVHGTGEDGDFAFEQVAYVRERDGRIAWLRIMCSGPRAPQA